MLRVQAMKKESVTKQTTWRNYAKYSAVAAVLVALIAIIDINLVAAGHDDGHDDNDGHETYAIGLWGDLPYSDVQATIGVPNLIADLNKQRLAFTVHDGDVKQGNGAPICDDGLYVQALGYFNSLKAPAMFTPGDNDWTDCDRPKNGGFNSLERLTHERAVMFNTPYSFGQRRIRQQVQVTPLCLGVSGPALTKINVQCVENRRWTAGGVMYVTLNIQGSCNNLCGDRPDPDEFSARNQADIAWMRESFAIALSRGSAAIMFIGQADPGFSESEFDAPQRDPVTLTQTDGNPDGFVEFLLAFRDEIMAFQRPVVYVHGDSHYFRIDKPLLDGHGARLENFTRVETFGDHAENGTNDVNWVKVLVDADSREVFAYQPQIVPGNRTSVPAP
jgi:hypothetical protein